MSESFAPSARRRDGGAANLCLCAIAALAASLALNACGGPPHPAPAAPTREQLPAREREGTPTSRLPSPAPGSARPGSAASGSPAPGVEGTPVAPPGLGGVDARAVQPTAFAAELEALGLDPGHLPRLEALEPRILRSVMKLFARSLGVPCVGCHEDGDFAAATRRKKIAARMWNEFAVSLTMVDRAFLFCDSCHAGRVRVLDRSDPKALTRWMDDNFVARLARQDGQPHDCETCHVDGAMHFLADWGR